MNKDLKETECEDVDWVYLAQDREKWPVLVKVKMNFFFPMAR
jgi:hypothetical protein